MLGGAAISSLLSVAFQKAFNGTSLTWLAGALAVATAIAAMNVTGAVYCMLALFFCFPTLWNLPQSRNHQPTWWSLGIALHCHTSSACTWLVVHSHCYHECLHSRGCGIFGH